MILINLILLINRFCFYYLILFSSSLLFFTNFFENLVANSDLKEGLISGYFNTENPKSKPTKVGINLKNGELLFSNSSILFDFKKKFLRIIYNTPYFSAKITPNTQTSGIVYLRVHNLLFGKAKFNYFLQGGKLYISKTDEEIFLKPIGFRIDKDQKLNFILDFQKMRFDLDEDEVKGFLLLNNEHKVFGEIKFSSKWCLGGIKFKAGKLLRMQIDLEKLDLTFLNDRCIKDLSKLLSKQKKAKEYCFCAVANIKECVFPAETIRNLKFKSLCINSKLESFLFTSKTENGDFYFMMDENRKLHIKIDPLDDMIKLFFPQRYVKSGELSLCLDFLDSNLHNPNLNYSGRISDLKVSNIYLLNLKTIFAPIRLIRSILKSPSVINCELNGSFLNKKLSSKTKLENSYNTILLNGDADLNNMKLDLKILLYYKNFLTDLSKLFSMDSLSDVIEMDISGDAVKPEMKVKRISTGAILGLFLQPFMI